MLTAIWRYTGDEMFLCRLQDIILFFKNKKARFLYYFIGLFSRPYTFYAVSKRENALYARDFY